MDAQLHDLDCLCLPACLPSRWDSIGADEEDEDPNLRNLDPEQREAMKAKVKNMESMLEAMRGGDMAGVSARLTGSAGGQAATVNGHDDPAIAAIIAETEVKALLDRCAACLPLQLGRPHSLSERARSLWHIAQHDRRGKRKGGCRGGES